MKKIILISLVVGAIGYYLYQKGKSTSTTKAVQPGNTGNNGNTNDTDTSIDNTVTNTSTTPSTGNSLEDFFNNLLNSGSNSSNNNTTSPASTVNNTTNDYACAAPVLKILSHNNNMEIFAEWQSDQSNLLKSVTLEYTKNSKDWVTGETSATSPIIIGPITNFNKNVTSKAGNSIMTVRLKGNCKNGKVTDYSNSLKYNLVFKTGSQLS